MKKTILHAAILAGLGAASSAQAVHVNTDGLGQVLLYPYYTVQNGFDTYVHVVNTTDAVKAVKVRFLEGKNSQEVLDFNLYLSPHDEWAGVITRSATSEGAVLKTADTSCIAPAQLPEAGQEFRSSAYQGDSVKDLARVREGYIEVIEMGEVQNVSGGVTGATTLASDATHTTAGVPSNCDRVRTAAKTPDADVATATGILNDNTGGLYITAPAGGLYGFASLISVNSGMKTSYDAVAVDNFYINADLHFPPGDTLPSLANVNTEPNIISGNQVVDFLPDTAGIDDLSSILMHDRIMNDYVVDAGRDSKTDWVITFPTKRFYVNGTTVIPPFSNIWSKTASTSCDEISLTYYDREEQSHIVTPEEDFSPRPPSVPDTHVLCNEVNTLTVKPHGAATDYAGLFGASYTKASFPLVEGFNYGWMALDFPATAEITGVLNSGGGAQTGQAGVVKGLPVIGFAGVSNTNGTLSVDGVNVLSNYMGSITHKATRAIVDTTVQ